MTPDYLLHPSLARMSPRRREETRGMQADVAGHEKRPVIVFPHYGDFYVRVMWENGLVDDFPREVVTPRPDLPRLA